MIFGVFSWGLLRIGRRNRGFNELSLAGFSAWGALSGLMLNLFLLAMAAVAGLNATDRGSVFVEMGVAAVLLGESQPRLL